MPDLILSCRDGREHAFDLADWDRPFTATATVFLIWHQGALVHVGLASDLQRRLAGTAYRGRLTAAGFGDAELYIWREPARPYPHRIAVADVRAAYPAAMPDLWPDENHIVMYRVPSSTAPDPGRPDDRSNRPAG